MFAVVNRIKPSSTRLKKTASAPPASSIPSSTPDSVTPVLPAPSDSLVESLSISSHELQEKVLQHLKKHSSQRFSDILLGLLVSADCSSHDNLRMQLKYTPLLREAIQSLSNDFCIYIDGDRYSAL